MPTDLEAQLQAGLPGRATEVVDFAALAVAHEKLTQAIVLITSARGAIAIVLGRDRPAVVQADAADLATRKALSDLERAIKNHPAGRVPR